MTLSQSPKAALLAGVIALLPSILVPACAGAERIAPLAPAPSFDALTVPMPPPQPPRPPQIRLVPNPPPVVIPPGSIVLPQPPIRIERTQAQVPPAAETPPSDPFQQGMEGLLDNVLRDMQPALDEFARGLDSTASRFQPALTELSALVDDIGNYQKPERLPNGDILIRRRADAPPPPELGQALRDLTTPDGAAGLPPGQRPLAVPEPGAQAPRPGTAQPAAPAAEPPALANPIPPAPDAGQTSIDL